MNDDEAPLSAGSPDEETASALEPLDVGDARRPLAPGLYLAATPIGSARDITLRALDLLAGAEIIAAEDTRTARHLMDIHAVALGGRPLVAYHDHSGEGVRDRLVGAIAEGRSVVYVSEAGTPLISDPGYALARAVIARGLPVSAAPGASAVLAALAVSGLPTDRFLFAGFLPSAHAAREAALAELRGVPATLVFYESPKRLHESLRDMRHVLGNRDAAVCRELTKRFEEVRRGSLDALVAGTEGENVRGEIVVVVDRGGAEEVSDDDVRARLAQALETMRLRDAATAVAGALGLPRNRVYQIGLGLKDGE